jgi:hypothetical protein
MRRHPKNSQYGFWNSNSAKHTLAFKVYEQGNPCCLLLALGQLGKDEVTSPSAIEANTLKHNSEWVEIVFRYTVLAHDPKSTHPLVDANYP